MSLLLILCFSLNIVNICLNMYFLILFGVYNLNILMSLIAYGSWCYVIFNAGFCFKFFTCIFFTFCCILLLIMSACSQTKLTIRGQVVYFSIISFLNRKQTSYTKHVGYASLVRRKTHTLDASRNKWRLHRLFLFRKITNNNAVV